jgi:hypothetical protein
MLPNHITIGISDDGQKVVFQPVHPLMPDVVPHEIPLADLECAIDRAPRNLGLATLEMLWVMHPDALAPYPGLLPPPIDAGE